MIDTRHIGTEMPPFTVEVEAGRLRFFSKAIGQAHDPAAPLPPTYLFCLEMDGPNPAAIRELLGLDYRRILHGEQGFTYHRLAYAGDRLTFRQRITDITAKKGGALEFITRLTEVSNQHGQAVAQLRCVTVVRNPT